MAKKKTYYIVNPAGAVHETWRENAEACLKRVGYRQATKDEIATYKGQRVQRADRPIAAPWSSEPEAIELDDDEEAPRPARGRRQAAS